MKKSSLFTLGAVLLSMTATAATSVSDSATKQALDNTLTAQPAEKGSLKDKIQQKFGEMPIIEAAPFDENDLVLIRLVDGSLLYTNDKVEYLIADSVPNQPQVYTRQDGAEQAVNLTASRTKPFNKALLTGVTDYIEVKSPTEQHVIYAFVDSACHYCQQMSKMIDEYSKANITVRFVPFPIFGQVSETTLAKILSYPSEQRFAKLVAAEDYMAKNGKNKVDFAKMGLGDSQDGNTASVHRSRAIGSALGIVGTPGIVLPSGVVISGLVKPAELLSRLQEGEGK